MPQPTSASVESRDARPTSAGRYRWAVLMSVVAMGAAGVGWTLWPVGPDAAEDAQGPAPATDGAAAAEESQPAPIGDAELRTRILGQWTLNMDGVRHLRIRSDGTASLDYRPNTAYSWILGERVEIELEWKLVDGKGYFRSLRGKPAEAFEWISTFKGTENVWEIREVDDEHALMWDEKDQSHYDWQRVAAPADADASQPDSASTPDDPAAASP